MRGKRHLLRGLALTFIVGALPFVKCAYTYANDTTAYKWMDDPHKHVGLTYHADAVIQPSYIWRGLYAGAANLQVSANVGYGGAYVTMWWNIGAADWSFKFLPELDVLLGFNRWGLNVFLLYIHNFDCGFFDFANYTGKGNRLEIDVNYTISNKIPLTFTWATRYGAADGYLTNEGVLKRAYSSYAAVSYTQSLPYDLSLSGTVGITPWRSVYSFYQDEFAVCNIEVSLRKDWSLSEHCGMMLSGLLSVNPSSLAADKHRAEWHPMNPGLQGINANIALGVYLK